MNAEQETDFETWAKLLICRKVPDDYQHLIDREVIKNGELILRRGDAFEIHIRPPNSEKSTSSVAKSRDAEILVMPLPHNRRATNIQPRRTR